MESCSLGHHSNAGDLLNAKSQLSSGLHNLLHIRLTTTFKIKSRVESSGKELDSVRLPKDKRGLLFKYSPSWFAGWQERYVQLVDRKLKYFKLSSKNKVLGEDVEMIPQGVFNFDQFMFEVEEVPDSKGLCFSINIFGIPERKFKFRADSVEESVAWQQEIKRHIDYSEGKKFNRSALGLQKPWKFDCISEN
mmetsp:Transcript_18036/g.30738  ORF Transcript_18036/g.30738 Transcript_18036/m.30738 type:complete len:192 (+) Transcript_18036:824-1399(+)